MKHQAKSLISILTEQAELILTHQKPPVACRTNKIFKAAPSQPVEQTNTRRVPEQATRKRKVVTVVTV